MNIDNDWDVILKPYTNSTKFKQIINTIQQQVNEGAIIYPGSPDLFKAFNLCSFKDTKVVIMGQDPYPNGEANGIAMAINKGVKMPKTLEFLAQEYKDDIGTDIDPTFESYYTKGVLFLNAAYTVEHGQPKAHLALWEDFNKYVMDMLNQKLHISFVFFGAIAQKFATQITNPTHIINKIVHPNAENYKPNAGFLGSRIFSKVNADLIKKSYDPIFK